MMDVYLTRHPIFDSDGGVFGFELLYREIGGEGAQSGAAVTASAGKFDEMFFDTELDKIVGGTKAVIRFDAEQVVRGVPRKVSPGILAVEISLNIPVDDELLYQLKNLKAEGYVIVLDDFGGEIPDNGLFEICDIVKTDVDILQNSGEETVELCKNAGKEILVKGLETASQFELAKKLGCRYTQGYYFVRPYIPPGGEIHPLPANLTQVMSLMAQPDPDINDIVDVMSRDTAMCQKILRLINSVYFGVSNKVSSINQAILILGLDYLREWVYLMGMQRLTQNDNVEAMKLALLLAKYCRGLSELMPGASEMGESFYLMGLLSMLVFGGDRALARALDEFPLSNDIKKGLLRRGGTYSDALEMALAYSDGRWDEFDELAGKYNLDRVDASRKFVLCIKEIGMLNML